MVAVENGKAQKETDEFQNVDYQVNQTLTVKMLNGKYTGKEFKVNNTYTKSGALDQRYYPGNQIFLSQLTKRNGHLTANVAGYKRWLWVVKIIAPTPSTIRAMTSLYFAFHHPVFHIISDPLLKITPPIVARAPAIMTEL